MSNRLDETSSYNPREIIDIDFKQALADTQTAHLYLTSYMEEHNIPKVHTYEVARDRLIELRTLRLKPEVHGYDATSHIESIKPELVIIEDVILNWLPEQTVCYYILRLYLNDLYTKNISEDISEKERKALIKKTKRSIDDWINFCAYVMQEGNPCGHVVYLFKSSFIFCVRIGFVDLFRFSDKTIFNLIEDDEDAKYYEINEKLEAIEDEIIDEYLKFDEIVIATNDSLRRALAVRLYMKSELQKKVPIKASQSLWQLDQCLRKAQDLYELEVLPSKIQALIDGGNNQKQIVELTGLSAAKVSKIVTSLKLKGI